MFTEVPESIILDHEHVELPYKVIRSTICYYPLTVGRGEMWWQIDAFREALRKYAEERNFIDLRFGSTNIGQTESLFGVQVWVVGKFAEIK